VFFVSGGSEAVESALKLARSHALAVGQGQRWKVISRFPAYHGCTLGALSVTGYAPMTAPYAPMMVQMPKIPAPRAWLDGLALDDPATGHHYADMLEAQILQEGPETVLAFIVEPVGGASTGALVPPAGYMARIRDICDRYGVLLILDEVMCGMGRTGSLFASDQDGVAPDIVTIAKGLGAGYMPIGAMLCSARIHDAIVQGSGAFQHGHTYHGHPLAAAAAHAVLQAILGRGLIGRVQEQGARLERALQETFGQHAHVGDIRGRGLFRAIELVEIRATKRAFDPARKLHARVKAAAMAEGLIVYPAGGTINGRDGDHVLIAPPFIIEDAQIDELVTKLTRAVEAALSR
jgi:adenosylmethionine-8-amino-7-oxononanoate aminotransferase